MNFFGSIVFVALLAVLAGRVQAAYTVDTGVRAPPATSLRDDGLDFQSLAATFSVATAYTIGSVEG